MKGEIVNRVVEYISKEIVDKHDDDVGGIFRGFYLESRRWCRVADIKHIGRRIDGVRNR